MALQLQPLAICQDTSLPSATKEENFFISDRLIISVHDMADMASGAQLIHLANWIQSLSSWPLAVIDSPAFHEKCCKYRVFIQMESNDIRSNS